MAFARGLRRGLRRVFCGENPRVAPYTRQGINRTKVSQAKRRHLGAGGFAEPGERSSGASGFCQFSVAEVIG
jgi:hypothetical protein